MSPRRQALFHKHSLLWLSNTAKNQQQELVVGACGAVVGVQTSVPSMLENSHGAIPRAYLRSLEQFQQDLCNSLLLCCG
jgi:hypothetical protein